MVKLRDYQQACQSAILDAYKSGVRRALVVLPTGTGKTVIFASLPRFFRMKNRMLVLAHREELLEQARDKFLRFDPTLRVDIEQAARRADPNAQVVVASVQTLGRRNSSRLRAFDPGQFKLVIVDEAHHAVARSYRHVLEYFGVFDGSTEKLLLGFTATPVRGDKQGLDQVFEKIVFSRSIGEMIQARHLCSIRGFRVETDLDLSSVHTRLGDFAVEELARVVNELSRNRQIVRAYQKLVPNVKALVFCVNVEHSQQVAGEFCRAGIQARAVWGEMPKEDRAGVLDEFRRGELRVIVNCNVLSEGYDDPSIEAILMARPTQSPLLYAQMIGRGTRPSQGKQHLTVIDLVDNTRRHELITLPKMFGLRKEFDLKGEDIHQMRLKLQRIAQQYPGLDFTRATSMRELLLMVERVKIVAPELADEVRAYSKLCWIKMPDESYWLDLGESGWLTIRQNLLDQWEAVLAGHEVAAYKDLERALRGADCFVEQQFPDVVKLLGQDLHWRDDPASEKQLWMVRRLGLKPEAGLTKGEAALLISSAKARQGARRATSPRSPA